MKLYLIKWDNGDIGIFRGKTIKERLIVLDEIGDPTGQKIKEIPSNIPFYIDRGFVSEELLEFINELNREKKWDTFKL